jgi:lysophospholipase L1-like esterase
MKITNLKRKLIVEIVLILLLFGSIFCYSRGGTSYVTFEVLTKTYYRVNNHNNIDGGIVFLGDSITSNVNWNALFNNGNIVNRGVSGNKITDIIERLDEVTKSKPKKIFLLIGINDIENPINSINQISSIQMNNAINNYSVLISNIMKESPQTKLYLESIMPVNNEMIEESYSKNKMYNFHINELDVKEFNTNIKQIALKNNLTFLDLHSAFLPNLQTKYTYDGLHPNTTGYLVIEKYLKQYVH